MRIVIWVLVVLLSLFILIGSRIQLNEYALLPGTAQPVQPFITVPPDHAHPVHHPVLLTDVEIGRVTALNYFWYKLHSDVTLEPLFAVTGGTDPGQLTAQGDLEMLQAEQAAKTAALRRLGYTVPARPAGAVIFGTFPGTPASGVLNVGDVVTAVNNVPTLTAAALTRQLNTYHPGQTIVLSVHTQDSTVTHPISVTLRTTRVNVGNGQYITLDLGIEPQNQVEYSYPIKVRINVANIGGPSAGLAMTLGVMDALTNGELTGGRTVAATGTMDAQGNVGDVGGVPQKTVAVERAGATIFLVPPQEYQAAKSKASSTLQVYAVSTLNQALAVLAAHGGTAVPAPGVSTVASRALG